MNRLEGARSEGAEFRVPVHLSLIVELTHMPRTMSQTPTSLAQVGFNGTTVMFFPSPDVSDLPLGSTCHLGRQSRSTHDTDSRPCSDSDLGGRNSISDASLEEHVARQAEDESIDAVHSGNAVCSHPVQVVLQARPAGV